MKMKSKTLNIKPWGILSFKTIPCNTQTVNFQWATKYVVVLSRMRDPHTHSQQAGNSSLWNQPWNSLFSMGLPRLSKVLLQK